MKNIFFFIFIALMIPNLAFCQKTDTTYAIDLWIEQVLKKETDSLRSMLENGTFLNDLQSRIIPSFGVDTFRIERKLHMKLDTIIGSRRFKNVSERSRATAIIVNKTNQEYYDLLDKYFQTLLQNLESSDKKLLIRSQKKWERFMTHEKATILITSEKYCSSLIINALCVFLLR